MSANLLEIDREIQALSISEQVWLLERIARYIRQKTEVSSQASDQDFIKFKLVEMASDPEIRAELSSIDHEFSSTEMDGLRNS